MALTRVDFRYIANNPDQICTIGGCNRRFGDHTIEEHDVCTQAAAARLRAAYPNRVWESEPEDLPDE